MVRLADNYELPQSVVRDFPPANIVEIRADYKKAGFRRVVNLDGGG